MSYQELDEWTDSIAVGLLSRRGESPEPIGLLFGLEINAFAATIGVLKSGKFYVMLDPADPFSRLAEILVDTGIQLLLTSCKHLALARRLGEERLQILDVEEIPAVAPLHSWPHIPADALAYVGYTSGSTGKPKGLMETHRNHLHHWRTLIAHQPNFGEEQVLFLNRLSFSGGQLAFYLIFLAGSTLCLYNVQDAGLAGLPDWIEKRQITVWNSVPSLFRAFVAHLHAPRQIASLRLLRLASDTLLPQDIAYFRRLCAPGCRLWVCYALTEAKTVTIGFMGKDDPLLAGPIPSGLPIPEMEVVIVDETGEALAPGQVGEIVVRSRFVSPGYWGDPKLTGERLQSDPTRPGIFSIRTGDLGSLQPNGNLIHSGRADSQVKIEGRRVVLRDVETCLAGQANVQEVVVTPFLSAGGETQICAYLVCGSVPPPSTSALRRALELELPPYMIPASFTFLEKMPLNANGKIDRLALPPPAQARPALDLPFAPPQTPVEKALTEIWTAVLGIIAVGRDDPFLELGGNSLQAMRIAAQVQDEFGVEIPLAELFAAGTVAEMALAVAAALLDNSASILPEKAV